MKKRRKLELVSLSIFIDDDVDEMFSSIMGCSEEEKKILLIFRTSDSKKKIFFLVHLAENL